MKKIVFTDRVILLPKFIEELKALKEANIVFYNDYPTDNEQLYERGKDAEIIVVRVVTGYREQILSRWPKLQTIITSSVATDHIDLAYCQKKNIKVINFPGFNARAVAEMVFANLITLLRKIPAAKDYVLGGGWNYAFFEGTELGGKNLGVIGAGNIGREVISIAKGLGMNVLCYTKNPSEERAKNLGLEKFYMFDEVLKNADFLVLTIPATSETEKMIGASELAKMKKTAYLINHAHYKVVDSFALAQALYEGKIAGAALDFIEKEPFDIWKADPRLQEMINANNVILTPHISWNTREAAERLGERMVTEIKRLI